MSFRLRVTALIAVAVAVASIGAAVAIYVVVQDQLTSQVDRTLAETAGAVLRGPRPDDRRPPFGRPPQLVSGRQDIFGQLVDSSGSVIRADLGEAVPALVTPEVREVAAGKRQPFYATAESGDVRVRVYVTPFGSSVALELARSLEDVDGALAETRVRLIEIALAGVLVAAALGALVARAVLAPVARLGETVEEVTRTRDLTRRVGARANDELGRLARSFDGMLAALEMSLRSQRQLVADASHELRTPLTSLRTNLELLERGQPTDEDDRTQLLHDLVAQMERLSTLVADLIDLARDEEAPLPIEDVRLDEIAAEAADAVRFRYPKVRVVVEATESSVRGVRSRILRAVTNLVDNAAKWSPAGATVEVSVRSGEVSVRDHGPGIALEDRPRVFDRFWRAASARHMPGSGLGLSIVKQVAEAHGGSVTFEDPPDGGARFRLRLSGVRA